MATISGNFPHGLISGHCWYSMHLGPEYLNIFKLEKIEEDANRFFNIEQGMKLKIDISHLNSSKWEDCSFNPKSTELIYERYKWCFDLGFYQK